MIKLYVVHSYNIAYLKGQKTIARRLNLTKIYRHNQKNLNTF